MKRNTKPVPLAREPEAVRRKLAAEYRRLAESPRHSPAERAEFARMAERWEATLPRKNK